MILQLKLKKTKKLDFVSLVKISHFGRCFFTFSRNFHTFGRHLLTKFFLPRKSPNSPLQNPNFRIFISLLVPEIFTFFTLDTSGPGFQITTFIFWKLDFEGGGLRVVFLANWWDFSRGRQSPGGAIWAVKSWYMVSNNP